jgi:acyl-CoA synthetase (AMP-forming)/AMP-acid ligase II
MPSSSNFPTQPPFERSPTPSETLDFHLEHNAEHPIYVYSEDADKELTSISFLEFARAGHRVAHTLRPKREGIDGRVVAVIMLVDTILYQATVTGLMRSGLVVSATVV